MQIRVVVLGREAEEVGEPAGARVDVDGRSEHVAAAEEDLLRPVAVVGVDVDHGDRVADAGDELGGGDGRVVQVAGAAVERPRDVVARRAAAGVGERFPFGDEVDGGERDVDRGARRLPRSRADERHRVVCEESGPRPDGGGTAGSRPPVSSDRAKT